jgi:glycosyltransferase involved in cell wall biosynthesis
MPFSKADPSAKLRIVHVFRAPLGGLFRHVVDLASEQLARGHEVGMFFDSRANNPVLEAAMRRLGPLPLGVQTRPIPRDPSPRDFAGIAACHAFLTRVGADVAHGHGSKGGLYARAPGLLNPTAGPIRAYTPHGGSFNYRPGTTLNRAYMGVERILARATDVLLFESGYIAGRFDAFVGKTNTLRAVVYNGLSDAEFQPAPAAPVAADLLYVGELRAAKGVDTMLKAIALLRDRRGRPVTACLVGSGPDLAVLRKMADDYGLSGQVTFPGPMPVRDAFLLGKILVVPSRAESLPYIVLEAAGARVPMLATDVGGIPEIFGPFKDRLGPSDDAASLANRIDAMQTMDEASIAEFTADLAMHVAGRFSTRRMTDSVIDGYRAAIRKREQAAAISLKKAG